MENTHQEFTLLLKAYERISVRNDSEQERLYHLVIGYIAGVAAALTYVLKEFKHFQDVDPIFWIAGSIATTLYLVFYSYSSVCLIDSALYLKTIWQRLNSLHKQELVPSWDGFVPETSFKSTRKILNVVFTAWRAIALGVAILLPFFSYKTNVLMDYVATMTLIFAIVVGGFVFIASTLYVAGSYRNLDVKKEISST